MLCSFYGRNKCHKRFTIFGGTTAKDLFELTNTFMNHNNIKLENC